MPGEACIPEMYRKKGQDHGIGRLPQKYHRAGHLNGFYFNTATKCEVSSQGQILTSKVADPRVEEMSFCTVLQQIIFKRCPSNIFKYLRNKTAEGLLSLELGYATRTHNVTNLDRLFVVLFFRSNVCNFQEALICLGSVQHY